MPMSVSCMIKDRSDGSNSDSPSLPSQENRPSSLVDCIVLPSDIPISNHSHTNFQISGRNSKNIRGTVFPTVGITFVTIQNLLIGFGSAKKGHQLRRVTFN